MNRRATGGFALILTLALLALMLLALWGLGAVNRIGHASATGAVCQMKARQHALLGFKVGLGDLQRLAGPDDRVTGMAGIAGVAPGANATTRYWTGVWDRNGAWLGWLASGAKNEPTLTGATIELYSTGSLGSASSTSANVEKEHVAATKIPIPGIGLGGVAQVAGHYAYVVIDEGVKVSAYAPVAERATPGAAPEIGISMLTNQLKLRSALHAQAGTLPAILYYEQLGLLAGLTPSVLQDCFHYVALTPRTLQNDRVVAGQVNVNTASALVWRSLLDTYNARPGVTPVANVIARGNQIGNGFAAATAGKSAGGPFVSLEGLRGYLETVFPGPAAPTAADIMTALRPMLTTRSDTFRIRAYGEALNPSDETIVEAVAVCEACVQRTPELLPGFGRRFVVTSFRWLGPEDL